MKTTHNRVRTPENSGTSAQILAALRAKKSARHTHTITERRRAAQALAASRMAAQIALDKLEARGGEIVEVA